MAEKKTPFENIFPYLSYRWKYDDGEYSPYAPFTEVQFLSKIVNDETERFENGFNVFMSNDLESININYLPLGGPDVVAVDILYTESISSTIYVLKTINIPVEDRVREYYTDININKRTFGIALPNSQLNRHFDSVPRKAKAQEFTANRLIYGNYLHKFDQEDLDVNGMDGPINMEVSVKSIFSERASGPSVKTNRSYDIGVIYMDRFGRQGGLLTDKAKPGSDNNIGSSIKTDFTYNRRIKLTSCIKSPPPSWAKYYRYYIKDVSTSFFNLTAYNTYIDGSNGDTNSPNVYLQFNSKDRNKITEDSFLIPRRQSITQNSSNAIGTGIVYNTFSRLPVLAIENEAPDAVKAQVIERKNINLFSIRDSSTQIVTGFNEITGTVSSGDTVFFIKDEGTTWDQQGTVAQINQYLTSQDSNATLFNTKSGTSAQIVNISGYVERLALEFKSTLHGNSKKILVNTIEYAGSGGSQAQRNVFKFTISNQINDDDEKISTTGIDIGGFTMQYDGAETINFSKFGLSEDGKNKLKGSFFVKVPRANKSLSSNLRAGTTDIPIGQTTFKENGDVDSLNFVDFETEQDEDSNLDLYWESSKTYKISDDANLNDHGEINDILWSNCIATVGGNSNEIFLESTNIQDKFNSTSLVKSIRVNTPDVNFNEETRKTGLIFSGLYNSRTGINELNQFSLADGITKDLEPNYGGIQKLYALDTNLVTFTEDKVFKVLADKDALFNADEGVNVTATNLVLGQAMTYQANYGISTHPESFAYFGGNIYFTDAKRGAVMQLTPANGQLFPISSNGMSNFFRDRISTANKLIGAYDGAKKIYVISMQGYNELDPAIGSESFPNEITNATLGYSFRNKSWTSRYSFIPETGLTLNNKFYTFKGGKIYLHNSDTAGRNNFYGVQYNSEVEIIFNDNPTYISDFLSINYEGSQDWEIVNILADQEENVVTNARLMDDLWFFKEGKYHAAIVGTVPVFIVEPGSSPNADGFYPLIQDSNNTQDVAGVKGFFAKVRLKNPDTDKRELFAVTTEYYISQT
jgi:hypothetical protein